MTSASRAAESEVDEGLVAQPWIRLIQQYPDYPMLYTIPLFKPSDLLRGVMQNPSAEMPLGAQAHAGMRLQNCSHDVCWSLAKVGSGLEHLGPCTSPTSSIVFIEHRYFVMRTQRASVVLTRAIRRNGCQAMTCRTKSDSCAM